MIQAEGITKGYGGRTLFHSLGWRLDLRQRIGLVGPNGAGKTTLCRILAGLEAPDDGRVVRSRGATVGYLPQEVATTGEGSVLAEALGGFEEVWGLERELERTAEALAAAGTGPESQPLVARYGELQQRFEAAGGYRLEVEARTILGGLGFAPADVTRPLAELSGGWRTRAALARLLLLRPDVLLLDEPTNHLDIESLGWLEDFLEGYEGAVVVVSHDRYFLNRMVTAIAELSPTGLVHYPGDYDDYVVQRQARQALREAQARKEARRVAEIERFIERFRYKATKARQVQSRVKMLERMERTEVEAEARRVHFAFPAPPRAGRVVASLRGIAKAYGDHVVYAGVDLDVERGDRIALVGANGAGKSTLLRILAGALPFDEGTRSLGTHVAVHYYAQHQLDALDPRRSALEELGTAAPGAGQTWLRTLLGAFLFSGDDVEKAVGVLSGGEKARLALAKMLVRPAALLCLDEPTNHLDLGSREVLEEALVAFTGTIVFVSHDRYFINRLATKIVEVAGGRLTTHLGAWDDYQEAKRQAAAVTPQQEPPADRPKPERAPRGARPATGAHRLRRRVEEIEARIAALEARLGEIGESLADPGLYADGARARAIALERRTAEEEVRDLMREWEDLATELAAHD